MTKILVVDDEEEITNLLVEELGAIGFEVISAVDGAMALSLIYRERPDVIILDLILPVKNGHDVLRTIRNYPGTKDIPVIVLTAISSKDVAEITKECGAFDHLTKPWKMADLLAVIGAALRK